MVQTSNQIKVNLARIHALMDSPLFKHDSSEITSWRPVFSELITLLNDVLHQADQLDKRVGFMDNVGVNGKIQDITSLVEWMHERLPNLPADQPGQLSDNHLNRYFDRGTGYFANGYFFTADFDDELAFFVDDQRIYLNRHIRRAITEAEKSLPNLNSSAL
ncbi:hypothetical protein [Spirosoma sp. KNUC1025]|uniref:hypothetical protein n=1 Tax=Spirosoma sp. KNUC1025 TaxID=2894082 RepID=UPI00386B1884|nr:hypothetical protein LN737_01520 [Spirosoma sp. KNUC1025]